MKIYVCHATSFDYKRELYEPLKRSVLGQDHELILPHETELFKNSQLDIESSDLVLAEVSYPSTGMGIELGWANAAGVKLLLICRNTATPSRSLDVLGAEMIYYDHAADLVQNINNYFN